MRVCVCVCVCVCVYGETREAVKAHEECSAAAVEASSVRVCVCVCVCGCVGAEARLGVDLGGGRSAAAVEASSVRVCGRCLLFTSYATCQLLLIYPRRSRKTTKKTNHNI